VWVRAQNPSIAATEKPMEFAFLNSIGNSPAFPPLDPWLSGYAISYYYFGYVMTSVIARLAFVAEPIAFNLGIAWLVAGTGTAAFGLVYNLVASNKLKTDDHSNLQSPISSLQSRAIVLGLIAAIAIPIAGNQQIFWETLHGNNIGSPQFWANLDIADLEGPANESPRYESSGWWWWRASRVINEYHLSGRPEPGLRPIAENPSFSFILGDMHPHVLALPFALLSLAVALAWWKDEEEIGDWRLEITNPQSLISNLQSLFSKPLFLFTILLLGGLSFLNTWDVLIHLFVVTGAYTLGQWRKHGGWSRDVLRQGIRMGVLLVVPAFFLYIPFYLGFSSQAGAPYLLPFLMRPTRIAHFLTIFAMPLWSILILLVTLAFKTRFKNWRAGILATLSLLAGLSFLMVFLGWIIASNPEGSRRVIDLANELNIILPAIPEGSQLGWGMSAILQIIPAVLSARIEYFGVTLLLSGILALVIMLANSTVASGKLLVASDDDQQPATKNQQPATNLPFVLLLILTGTLLTLGPEFVYLRDNFGQRLNTVFKFYYQAWILFGIAGIFALDYLWRELKAAGTIAGIGYLAMFIISLSFPFYAVQSRQAEYGQPPTLNGLAYVQQFRPDDYDAIMWLRENGTNNPVLVEAVGGQYSEYARISANTGLPTLLGWQGHENQWRGYSHPEPGRRDPLVREIYESNDWERTKSLLNEFGVDYVYVGNLERSSYGQENFIKFEQNMDVAFANNSVTIYKWQAKE
jgi:YYY domain-containing protein